MSRWCSARADARLSAALRETSTDVRSLDKAPLAVDPDLISSSAVAFQMNHGFSQVNWHTSV
jgi:hypothetical protein